MIYGIGTDICDMRRIQTACERHGERFAQRVLAPGELATWQERRLGSAQRALSYLATRFAAKEAFSKAIGLGMCHPMAWQRCEIVSQPGGSPLIVLHDPLKTWFTQRGLRAHISLSDEPPYATSFVVVERDTDAPTSTACPPPSAA